MHEKELRLALVCYGGVSLAVYMSGVTLEVLKVVRASKNYHAIIDREARHATTYDNVAGSPAYETDTERLYFELLQAMAPELELRVVVDIVSGASAGGINAIFLARALAHDLSLDGHRKMWLHRADVTELMEPDTIADRWSKFYLYPFFWMMNLGRLKRLVPNDETRRKLSIFMRSRWFKPPFSGRHMLDWMLEGCAAMGKSGGSDFAHNNDSPSARHPTLMPPGLRLDLFVSLTNFHGRHQEMALHDPATITERDHRTSLTFSYLRRESGAGTSDFGDSNIPGLAFAARATSSFPGAFPAARIDDLDASLEAMNMTWPQRGSFLRNNFPGAERSGRDPGKIFFIDGSVVNNKPFSAAINALTDRPAHREVDRRIVYIDPVPENLVTGQHSEAPGFFRSILASLSEIPRNEPINDELQWINTHNRKSRRLGNIVASVEAEVEEVIEQITMEGASKKPGVELVASWRERINIIAKQRAGYTYAGYSHTKIYAIFEHLTQLVCELCEAADEVAGGPRQLLTREAIFGLVHAWARDRHLVVNGQNGHDTPESEHAPVDPKAEAEALVAFLRDFDVDFRVRRLRFVVSNLNEVYQSQQARESELFDPHQLNEMKRDIYISIDQLKDQCRVTSFGEAVRSEVTGLLGAAEGGIREVMISALGQLLDKLAILMALQERDGQFDAAMSAHTGAIKDPDIAQNLFRAYIAFPFYDVLSLPLLQANDMSGLEEIRVDRISPDDCGAIRRGSAEVILKGVGFQRFAGFFSRAGRENDYIWGRLNSAERMVDFIISASEMADGTQALDPAFDLIDFKKRLFLSILDAEVPHLIASEALIAELRAEIEALH